MEIWYGFSTYIPEEFPIVDRSCVIAQWHSEHDPGEVSRSPVLAHRYKQGKFYVDKRYSWQKIQKANDGTRIKLYQQERFPRETWHDFIYCIKWSHAEDGYVKGWLNRDQIIDYEGPIGYFDDEGPYFKSGYYHHTGELPFVTFHDEYRRGWSYQDVRPPVRSSPACLPDSRSDVRLAARTVTTQRDQSL